jgi:hypothetical protein
MTPAEKEHLLASIDEGLQFFRILPNAVFAKAKGNPDR